MNIHARAAKVLQEIDEQLSRWEREVTAGPWTHSNDGSDYVSHKHGLNICLDVVEADATFIAASRTGWPTALRCLKTAIEGYISIYEVYDTHISSESAAAKLTTICDQWEDVIDEATQLNQ